MPTKFLMALAALAAALCFSQSASAFDLLDRFERPDLRYHEFDPDKADALERYYHYYYDPRGWYPYYNSGEWGGPSINRFRGELPPYYASWGADKHRYHHVEWHRRHYGGHRKGDW